MGENGHHFLKGLERQIEQQNNFNGFWYYNCINNELIVLKLKQNVNFNVYSNIYFNL